MPLDYCHLYLASWEESYPEDVLSSPQLMATTCQIKTWILPETDVGHPIGICSSSEINDKTQYVNKYTLSNMSRILTLDTISI